MLDGREAYRVVLAGSSKVYARLRFGSQGDLVNNLQKALKSKGFYKWNVDDDFGNRILRAVLQFQTASFGQIPMMVSSDHKQLLCLS
ncbi:MAG: peptidoglycan-binding protein [Ignavibacteriaceae bacterium]|nr:peptidoglycan-binding protein [Ignavibacteriaceae bacterium]